jgi:hypothetical protein
MVKQPLRLATASAIGDEEKGPPVGIACTEHGGGDIPQITSPRHSWEILERIEPGVLLQANGPEPRPEQDEAERTPLGYYSRRVLLERRVNFGSNTIDVNVELILRPAGSRVYCQTDVLDRNSTVDSFEYEFSGIECRTPELLPYG